MTESPSLKCVLMVILIVAGLSTAALATPTGLNNIPTAEVVPQGLLVLQGFSEFGRERPPAWFAGAKFSPAKNLEIGIDDRIAGPGSSAGPVFQAKYRLAINPTAGLALGAANISDNSGRNGHNFPYLVISRKLASFNLHLGYSWQEDNRAWFAGIDRAVNPHLTLRADWTQVEDGGESAASLGFIRQMNPRWLIEAWSSFPTASGAHTSHIVKLDYVIPLK